MCLQYDFQPFGAAKVSHTGPLTGPNQHNYLRNNRVLPGRKKEEEGRNLALKNEKSTQATNEAAKAEIVCIGDDIRRRKKTKGKKTT